MDDVIGPKSQRQEDFLLSQADITVFGGAAGSGKSYVGLMTPLLFVDDPYFRGVIFRRTMPEITAGDWEKSPY